MIHAIRWLGLFVLSASLLRAGEGVAQAAGEGAAQAAPGATDPRPGASASAATDAPAANAGGEEAKGGEARADDFDRTPRDCITTSNIRQTVAVDDSTILFYMRGGNKATYRSVLGHACPNLARENRFSYKVTMNRLCNTDLITVLEQYGAGLREGFTCRLGSFYPIPYEEAELLRKEHDKPNSTRGGMKTKPAEVPQKGGAAPAAAGDPAPPPANDPAPQGAAAPR